MPVPTTATVLGGAFFMAAMLLNRGVLRQADESTMYRGEMTYGPCRGQRGGRKEEEREGWGMKTNCGGDGSSENGARRAYHSLKNLDRCDRSADHDIIGELLRQ